MSAGSRRPWDGPLFAWSPDGAFLVQHADFEPSDIDIPPEWVANSPFPTYAVIGVDDESGEFSMLYGDARGVHRVYRMTLAGETWTIWRESPGLHQRYVGRFGDDGATITGGWHSSEDGSSLGTGLRAGLPKDRVTPSRVPVLMRPDPR